MLVKLNFDSSTSTLYCLFLNENDDSRKRCSIVYGRCGQQLTRHAEGYSSVEQPNKVSLDLTEFTDGSNCYVVIAKSSSITIKVEGTLGIYRVCEHLGSMAFDEIFEHLILYYANFCCNTSILGFL